MKTIKKIWKWFSGKKTAIGYIGVQFCITGFAKSHIQPDTLEIMQLGFSALGGLGVLHKVSKSDINKKLMSNLKTNKR